MEACELTADGRIYLTAGVGISPTVARLADKVIVEINAAHNKNSLMGMHEVFLDKGDMRLTDWADFKK